MSGDRFRKTQAGRPLEIPASTWNAMVDAARAHADRQHDQDSRADLLMRQGDVIKVRNQSGQDLDRFAVLGIDSAIIRPDANQREFKNQPATNAIIPADTQAGQFVILLDPLRSGRIGRAWASGVCICQIRVDEDWHTFADVEPGNITSLISKPDGGARILWREDSVGVRWAIVRLSNASRTHYLARIPGGGIPGRQGLQTGSATCELFTVDHTGLIEPVERPDGEAVNVTVRHHGTQPIRGPVDENEPQYLGVNFDGRGSWLLDPPKQTLLCKPGRRIKAKSWGTARELRFTGEKWSASGSVVAVYNVCDYALLPSQQIICHFHEDTSAYLTIGCRCCDGSSSSFSSSDSSSSSDSESDVSSSSSDSSSSSGSSTSSSSVSSTSTSGSSLSGSSAHGSSLSSDSSHSESDSSHSVSHSDSRPSESYSMPTSSDSSDSTSHIGSQPSSSGSASASDSQSDDGSTSPSESDTGSDSRSFDSRSLPSTSTSEPPSQPPPGSSSSGCSSTWLWSCGWELVDSDCDDPQAPSSSGAYDGELLETAG